MRSLISICLIFFALTQPLHADPSGSMFDRETRREAQQALNHFGFDAGTPDGIFGQGTQAAIRRYQSAQGGLVTGEFSRASMGLLLQAYRSEQSSSSGSSGSGLPASVSTIVSEMAQMCNVPASSLMSKSGFLQQADLNGDGRADYLIDGSSADCMMLCGASNCQVNAIASTSSGGYRDNAFLGYSVTSDTFRCAADGSCDFAR